MYEYKDGKPFDWEEVIPGFSSTDVKDKTFVSVLAEGGKTVASYPEYKDKLLEMYSKRDPRMSETIIMPYTTYPGWVNNQPKTCEFIIARNIAPNETNCFIRLSPARTESYIFRKVNRSMFSIIYLSIHITFGYKFPENVRLCSSRT